MGILDAIERMLITRKVEERIELKEIYSDRTGGDCIKTFRTPAVGTEHRNMDGTERQDALKKIKTGEKVRLILDAGGTSGKSTIYLVRKGKGADLAMADCFGRLNDKVATNVIRWLNQDNVVTSATVAKITGGTAARPKLGCVLELRTFPGPKPKEGKS